MSRYITAIRFAVAVLVVVIIFSFFAPRILSGFFSEIFSPLWRIAESRNSAQVASLQEQLQSFEAASSSIAFLEQENAELKSMLGRTPAATSILATVLKKPPFSSYDNLIIDVGADHGVVVGDIVYAMSPAITIIGTSTDVFSNASSSASSSTPSAPIGVHIPIGVIAEVDPTTSKVDLFSSPDEKYTVEIGTHHLAVNATGRGSGSFQAILPREAGITVGDLVTIPSIQPIVFSTVSDILSDPARPYATVLFQSPINITTLHWVEVGIIPVVNKPTVSVKSNGSH